MGAPNAMNTALRIYHSINIRLHWRTYSRNVIM
ncbi:unnamed protein product [Oppiella nova]|uniref:Uncharacterized protein n=1 Tax=Oppiella nova TaxID=334625 RepID=A0A7R9QVS3_9ACAR|nr:unnamed protein product [Oppiella nova]CAG2176178.1 unnamed protein product [Oppiella nova]